MQAISAAVPTPDGYMGILGRRAPLVSMIGSGQMVVRPVGEDSPRRMDYYISGGFARAQSDNLVVLAEECIPAGDIDREQAWENIALARKMPSATVEQAQARSEALASAQVKFNLAQKCFVIGQVREDLETP